MASRSDVLEVREASEPNAAPSPNPWIPMASAASRGVTKPCPSIVGSWEKTTLSAEKKSNTPTTNSNTSAACSAPPVNPPLTSSLAEPSIVSTKNQKKIPSAKAVTYLVTSRLPTTATRTSPPMVGMTVEPIKARKLSVNGSTSKNP